MPLGKNVSHVTTEPAFFFFFFFFNFVGLQFDLFLPSQENPKITKNGNNDNNSILVIITTTIIIAIKG